MGNGYTLIAAAVASICGVVAFLLIRAKRHLHIRRSPAVVMGRIVDLAKTGRAGFMAYQTEKYFYRQSRRGTRRAMRSIRGI